MKVRDLIIGIIICTFFACEEENPTVVEKEVHKTDLNLITGIECLDQSGSPMDVFGNPNKKTRVALPENSSSGIQSSSHENITLYPNPFKDVFFINTSQTIEEIWLVKGEANTTFQNVNFENVLVDTTGIENVKEMYKKGIGKGSIALNLSELDSGFYKIIIRTSLDELVFIPTYKAGENMSFDDQTNFFEEIWKE